MTTAQKQDQLFRAFQRFMEQNQATGSAGLSVADTTSFPVASRLANAGMQLDGIVLPPSTGTSV
jgi:hypothetical protein